MSTLGAQHIMPLIIFGNVNFQFTAIALYLLILKLARVCKFVTSKSA